MTDDRRTLTEELDILDVESLPIAFGLLKPLSGPPPCLPAERSVAHRSNGYFCFPFYKPVSRCLRTEED